MPLPFKEPAAKLGDSPLFVELAKYYAYAPSAIIARVAEVELLRAVEILPPALDLCCGDGYIASLLGDNLFIAGCDFSEGAVDASRRRGLYKQVHVVDITKKLPYPPESFNTVISNSALEHVEEIDAALRNVREVLKPGGKLIFTLASNYAYEWWPCGKKALDRYLDCQPVHNKFSLEEWKNILGKAGMKYCFHRYYLSRPAARLLLFIDYYLSRSYLTSDNAILNLLGKLFRRTPENLLKPIWTKLFFNINISASETGGGILIIAAR